MNDPEDMWSVLALSMNLAQWWISVILIEVYVHTMKFDITMKYEIHNIHRIVTTCHLQCDFVALYTKVLNRVLKTVLSYCWWSWCLVCLRTWLVWRGVWCLVCLYKLCIYLWNSSSYTVKNTPLTLTVSTAHWPSSWELLPPGGRWHRWWWWMLPVPSPPPNLMEEMTQSHVCPMSGGSSSEEDGWHAVKTFNVSGVFLTVYKELFPKYWLYQSTEHVWSVANFVVAGRGWYDVEFYVWCVYS